MDLFFDNEIDPAFNLVNVEFKQSLKHLSLVGDDPIRDNCSFMISSLLDTTISLE